MSNMLRSIVFLFSFITVFAGAQSLDINTKKNELPEIGVVASNAISIDKEVALGDIMMRQLRSQAPILNDPLLEEYIQDLGNRMVAHASNVKFPFKFFLINNQDINAFAFFGGHIGVHSGTILSADTESELASVLAHEVSHVTQRHIARGIEARNKSGPMTIASMLGGLLLAMASPEAGFAAISAGQAASAQSSINYTRHNEQEADRVGMQILSDAGFNPTGAAAFFAKLAEKNRFKSKSLSFLMTHPLPESRIADVRSRASRYRQRNMEPSLNFHLAKARITARYSRNAKQNILFFKDQLNNKDYVFKQAIEYGLALALFDNEQVSESSTIIRQLRVQDPENLFYLDLETDILIQQQKHQRAMTQLETLATSIPRNRVISLNLANAAIKAEQYPKATQVLKDYLLVNPEHLLAYDLISDAYGKNSQFLEMHQTKAEVYALLAAYPRAIDELQKAYKFAGTRKLEKQRIRARIEQLRDAKNKQKKAM